MSPVSDNNATGFANSANVTVALSIHLHQRTETTTVTPVPINSSSSSSDNIYNSNNITNPNITTDATNTTLAELVWTPDATPQSSPWSLEDSPWVPALVVGCSMVIFLSISFYSHHKRVSRKRKLLMDYLSTLLYSGAWARGRSVSILCNTNCMTLSDLGRSFKIKFKDDVETATPSDFLRKKYFKDLLDFATSDQKPKKGIKRFISAPGCDHKIQRVASHLISNKGFASKFSRGGIKALARNLSLPVNGFDSCDIEFSPSLIDARQILSDEDLLDPNKLIAERNEDSSKFQRSFTIGGHYCDNTCKSNVDYYKVCPSEKINCINRNISTDDSCDGSSYQRQFDHLKPLQFDHEKSDSTSYTPLSKPFSIISNIPLSSTRIPLAVTESSAISQYSFSYPPTGCETLKPIESADHPSSDSLLDIHFQLQDKEKKKTSLCPSVAEILQMNSSETDTIISNFHTANDLLSCASSLTSDLEGNLSRTKGQYISNKYDIKRPISGHLFKPFDLKGRTLNYNCMSKLHNDVIRKSNESFVEEYETHPTKMSAHQETQKMDKPLLHGESVLPMSIKIPDTFLPNPSVRHWPSLLRNETSKNVSSGSIIDPQSSYNALAMTIDSSEHPNAFIDHGIQNKALLRNEMSTTSTLLSNNSSPTGDMFGSFSSESTPSTQQTSEASSAGFQEETNSFNDPNDFSPKPLSKDQLSEKVDSWEMSHFPRRSLPAVPNSTHWQPGGECLSEKSQFYASRSSSVISKDYADEATSSNLPSFVKNFKSEVQQTSDVYRLPRFQIRSVLTQQQKTQADDGCDITEQDIDRVSPTGQPEDGTTWLGEVFETSLV